MQSETYVSSEVSLGYIGKLYCRAGIKNRPQRIYYCHRTFSPLTNNVTEQDGDRKYVYVTYIVEEYSFYLPSPPITIPREPKLAKPQRA